MGDRGYYVHQFNCQKIDGVNEELQAGRTGRPFSFNCVTNIKVGGWFNAAKAQLDFGSAGTGEVTGMASAFNAEILLPNKTTAGGAYVALETNLNFQASSIQHTNPVYPTAIASFKVVGTQAKIDGWEDNASAALFWLDGFSAADGSVFATGTGGAMAASLKIIIGSTPYYIMLATTPSTA